MILAYNSLNGFAWSVHNLLLIIMPLAVFRANVDFSQSSLSSEGNEACWPMSAKLFEEHLQEQMRRVLQPPRCERPLALKNRPKARKPTGAFS
jgi:hypothetical protein